MHDVTDVEPAFGRDHVADGDGPIVHVAQATARDAQIQRPVSAAETPAAGHGVSQPRPRSSRKTSVCTMPVAVSTPGRLASWAAVLEGSGAPSRPVTT